MTLIPDEELLKERSINLAPLVDFLFLIIAVLATLAVTRAALYDTDIHLVRVVRENEKSPMTSYDPPYIVNLTITARGQYKWITEMDEYLMSDVAHVQKELIRQQELGLLPKEKSETKILLHIDKDASWDPIAKLIFAVRESGFQIHPVYEPDSI
jgi:biopolymer transport protein ExbD